MKIDWSEPGVPVSAIAHAALLVASLVAFSSTEPFADAQESVPVDIISAEQFNAITKGEKTAKEVQPTPKPRVDKVAETEQLKPTQGTDATDVPTPPSRAPEISDEPNTPPLPPVRPPEPVKPEKAETPKPAEPPKPEPPKADAEIPKPPEKPQPAKPEPPKEVAEKPKPPKLDTTKIAQLLEHKKVEPPKPVKPPARVKGETSFSASAIEKLLISKEKPQASGPTGAQLQKVASLGTEAGSAPKLSPSMTAGLIGVLQEQVNCCFSVPPGINGTKLRLGTVRVAFNEDGSLAERPQIANSSSDPDVRAVAEALQRAVLRCAPYRIPAQYTPYYDAWKNTVFEPPDSLE